ncbi:MAG TPA: LPS assembly lipoprotein LptE [Bdellovibrionales bacterium]|nr:LPS assembly lipoprotein LptE [Bdellovibrionales bacterium]
MKSAMTTCFVRLRNVPLAARMWPLAICVLLSSCAYHFGSSNRSLPGGYTKVSVPIFKNSTGEVGVETYFTTAMIEELERHDLAEVTGEHDAQVELQGTIQNIRYERGAYQPIPSDTSSGGQPNPDLIPLGTALAKEYYISVSTEVKLVRRSDQKVLWSNTFNSRRQYPAPYITTIGLNSANALYNHSARLQNIATMAKEMMEQAHNHMTENF